MTERVVAAPLKMNGLLKIAKYYVAYDDNDNYFIYSFKAKDCYKISRILTLNGCLEEVNKIKQHIPYDKTRLEKLELFIIHGNMVAVGSDDSIYRITPCGGQ